MSNNNINKTDNNKLCDQTTRRRICSLCERPATVCLCHSIPAEPLSTSSTQIIILQHPHEQRHPLATVPLLNKCLKNCHIITGRRLRRGVSAVLDSLYDDAEEKKADQSVHAAFLFPGTDQTPSMEINEWKSSFGDADLNKFVLIAFDGTWKHAKEMVFASFPFVSKFATQGQSRPCSRTFWLLSKTSVSNLGQDPQVSGIAPVAQVLAFLDSIPEPMVSFP